MHLKSMSLALAAALALGSAQVADSQVPSAPAAITYADLADLALAAPVTAHVRVARTQRLREAEAANVPPGHSRFLVEADLVSLIRGPGMLAQRVGYLVDLPNDARGRAAAPPRRSEFLLFAAPVAGRPGELRLIAPDAQLPFSPARGDQVRAILREASQPETPARITGIGRAFHVPGTLPGESETQFFLQTADNRPISLIVLRRPDETPRWSVALGELVDDAARPPERDTLLWYRLACTLPDSLPRQSLSEAGPAEAGAISADYRLIRERLGPCPRSRIRR